MCTNCSGKKEFSTRDRVFRVGHRQTMKRFKRSRMARIERWFFASSQGQLRVKDSSERRILRGGGKKIDWSEYDSSLRNEFECSRRNTGMSWSILIWISNGPCELELWCSTAFLETDDTSSRLFIAQKIWFHHRRKQNKIFRTLTSHFRESFIYTSTEALSRRSTHINTDL